MESNLATTRFAALSQPTRLAVFRLLIQAGQQGLLAGEIAEALSVRQNTMSANLSVLVSAGLLRNQRQGRSIRYFADLEGLGDLLGYLLEDCCGGAPETCQPIIRQLTDIEGPGCCASPMQSQQALPAKPSGEPI